jgi:predicted GIY-YIG superfamily endonuclease
MQRQLSLDDRSAPDSDSLIRWRGSVALHCPPPVEYYVYLLHFHSRYYHAGHYLGVTACLDARLLLHKMGRGARLMNVVVAVGITFELARLWKLATWEEARGLERTLKKRHNGPGLCPLCRGEQVDLLVALRQGHWPLAFHARPGRRQPLGITRPHFVRRCVWESGNLSRSAPDLLNAATSKTNRRPAHG